MAWRAGVGAGVTLLPPGGFFDSALRAAVETASAAVTIHARAIRCVMPGLARRRERENGGAERDRTVDLLNAIQALSQTELQPHLVRRGAEITVSRREGQSRPGTRHSMERLHGGPR